MRFLPFFTCARSYGNVSTNNHLGHLKFEYHLNLHE